MRFRTQAALTAALLSIPAIARAAGLGPADIFVNAAPLPKALMIGLLAAMLAGVVVAVRKLASGPRLAGGSAFIAGLRVGGPLAGILGGAYAALRMSIGIANVSYEPTLKMLAPGFAEVAALVVLGFLAGVVAIVLNWAIEARIDREVLRG
jgi:hypothetical protein